MNHFDEVAEMTLFMLADSWYLGANIPGKPRATFVFAGGAPLYRAICAESQASGWAGFHIDDAPTAVPPMASS